MLIERYHLRVKVLVDKIDSSYYEEILPEEIDEITNDVYLRLVKRVYNKNNIYKRGFEESQKRTDDLKNLVKSYYTSFTLVDYFGNGDNVYRLDIGDLFEDKELTSSVDEEYLFFIKAILSRCTNDCCQTSSIKVVQQDDLSTLLDDPFNNPSKSKPVLFFERSTIYVWTGKYTMDNFLLTFLKKPKDVNIGTYGIPKQEFEVSSHLVDEIAIDTSQVIIELIESKRVQTNPQNQNLKE